MGHGLNNTVQDVLVRFERMRGRRALWLPGTDHAGIATQNVVERIVATRAHPLRPGPRSVRRAGVGLRAGNRRRILEQLGASALGRLVPHLLHTRPGAEPRSASVRPAPRGGTHLSRPLHHQLVPALPDRPLQRGGGKGRGGRQVWYLIPAARGGYITVATARPETMLGDTAVAVHPGDERYRHLMAGSCALPVVDRLVPVVADDAVDPAFGTGAVKVIPPTTPRTSRSAGGMDWLSIDVMTPERGSALPPPSVSRGSTASRRAGAWSREFEAADSSRRWSPTGMPSATATAAIPLSSRGSPTSGSCGWPPWPGRARGVSRRHPDVHPRAPGRRLRRMAGGDPRLGYLAAALVGPPHSGVVLPGGGLRAHDASAGTDLAACPGAAAMCARTRTCSTPGSLPGSCPLSLGWPERTADLARFYPGHTLVSAPEIIFFWVSRMIMSG